ncbi:ExbD/TolR family protein [Azospira restricta]|uniref:Biopolymer transporter ExbD n=1 Tax=Azospira restricta TaxID=404405 RepID=A0A974SRY1_9RHOO|nr:biopolymer transporter ExbD [Azospira restricta]QRJ65309.1 biopolymer transporter ExbD [Azospira restricta]
MSFGSFDGGGTAQPMAEINTTPLVDVMLVLLVIFIITAPLFQQAVPVDLPQVAATKLDDRPRLIAVAIDGDGKVFVDGVVQHRSALPEVFAAALVNGRDPELHLRADRGTRYERVTEVLADAQRAGIVKIAFVTEPAR